MTTIDLKFPLNQAYKSYTGHVLFGILLLLYTALRTWINFADPVAVAAVETIWLLIITSALVFLSLLVFCWWLIKHALVLLGLPGLNSLIPHFENLKSWQKLGFYASLFALLLVAATGCLIAIC